MTKQFRFPLNETLHLASVETNFAIFSPAPSLSSKNYALSTSRGSGGGGIVSDGQRRMIADRGLRLNNYILRLKIVSSN